jgi:hypothetical protein
MMVMTRWIFAGKGRPTNVEHLAAAMHGCAPLPADLRKQIIAAAARRAMRVKTARSKKPKKAADCGSIWRLLLMFRTSGEFLTPI